MNKDIKFDKFQLGQQIRFLAHMLSVAMKSKNPDMQKKEEEYIELKKHIEKWQSNLYPETPDILWARRQAERFGAWKKNPRVNIIHPVEVKANPGKHKLEKLIKERRSIRYWKKEPVPKDLIDRIMEAGLYAPSAFNRLPWRFFVAETPPDQIREGDASNPGMFEQAPVRIFVTVDERLFFEKYSGALDAGLAMQNMLLVAHELGLGTCLIYQGEFVDKKLLEKHYRIPEYCTTYCVILLGYPDEVPEIPARMPLKEVTEYLGEVPNPEF